MRLGKISPVVLVVLVLVCLAFLPGCNLFRGQRPVQPEPIQPSASRPPAPPSAASQPTARITRPVTTASRPAVGTAPVAPAGIASGALQPCEMPAHPFMLFGAADVAELAKRKDQDPLLKDCWDKLAELAAQPDQLDEWWDQLEARAFLAILTNDEDMAAKAIDLMQAGLDKTDPGHFYEIGAANFHSHAAPLRALALGWDWLYSYMTPPQRGAILSGLERWCHACLTCTDKRWWREASYNVGSIPIGGLGILALAIRPDSAHPDAALWLREATRRLSQNFFPTSWKPSGICWEGPNYAIVGLKYPALFAEALRRCGGQDMAGDDGATLAMQYLMHQWMPQEGCAPIGDNTSYGRRTFAAEYLLGIARSKDAVGLWTWRNYVEPRYLDSLITYLWYPLDLHPVGPVAAEAPLAKYFEVTGNRAGYFFSRTGWQDPDAAFFSFVTRYERCNHEHYDMNSFLLGAYGTLFATHEMLFPYGHKHHGVDFEHNMIIIDEGGWPRHDNPGSCGDDNSTQGVLVGLASGPFADYVRGDAKWSYRDNSIIIDNPAIRAERAFLFVKAGPVPYMLAFDDIQFSDDEHVYKWQWHAPTNVTVTGAGSVEDPLVLAAKRGCCAIHFVTPALPTITNEKAPSLGRRDRSRALQRIVATQKGVRVRYAAVATLQETPELRPAVTAQPVACESESAGAVQVRLADGETDLVAWQSEEVCVQRGSPLATGPLQTDGLLALVRVKNGEVVGYVLGEGTYLRYGDKVLVQSPKDSVCVTADAEGVRIFGRLQTRRGLAPVEPVDVETLKLEE